ncbi:MAG: hypothetical protein K5685_01385 [Bacteroidales bacterium]|nr:hypothetical protein [Bacteroidales bacterium]
MHPNTIKRALIIKHLVDDFYEQGNQSRCMLQAYRLVVKKYYPCSIATFYRYIELGISIEGYIGNGSNRKYYNKPLPKNLPSEIQLSLF